MYETDPKVPGRVIWRMLTQTEAKGSIPSFVINKMSPKIIGISVSVLL